MGGGTISFIKHCVCRHVLHRLLQMYAYVFLRTVATFMNYSLSMCRQVCVLVLIIYDEMRFYIYSTRVVVCHEMFCIPVGCRL